jgi:dihydroorotate dehydrogenase electron transfer subunit
VRRETLPVAGVDRIGLYSLVRVRRGGLESGVPGQFFMLSPPGRLLPRPMSLCLATRKELGFLIDPIGPGTRALIEVARSDRLAVLGPLGNGYRLDVQRPLLVGGGIGIAPFPYLSERLGRPPAVLGFRTKEHAEAAVLVPNAEIVVEPRLVTELHRPGHDVLGYGACYGCAVEIDGTLKRLCVEGPILIAEAA